MAKTTFLRPRRLLLLNRSVHQDGAWRLRFEAIEATITVLLVLATAGGTVWRWTGALTWRGWPCAR